MSDVQITRIKDISGTDKIEITDDSVEVFLTSYDNRKYTTEEFVDFVKGLITVATRFVNERDALVINTVSQFLTVPEEPKKEQDEFINLDDIYF